MSTVSADKETVLNNDLPTQKIQHPIQFMRTGRFGLTPEGAMENVTMLEDYHLFSVKRLFFMMDSMCSAMDRIKYMSLQFSKAIAGNQFGALKACVSLSSALSFSFTPPMKPKDINFLIQFNMAMFSRGQAL